MLDYNVINCGISVTHDVLKSESYTRIKTQISNNHRKGMNNSKTNKSKTYILNMTNTLLSDTYFINCWICDPMKRRNVEFQNPYIFLKKQK